MRYAARLAYDGTAYFGWQRQGGARPTVQGAFENALGRVLGTPAAAVAAGRTDTGVHAVGQVVSFEAEWAHGEAALARALNAALPADIAVTGLAGDMGDFHARYSAIERVYNYTVWHAPVRSPLLRQRAWHLRGPLDFAAADAAAAHVVGTHDCAALGRPPQGENTVRTITASSWERAPGIAGADGAVWVYRVRANAFLQHMVRRLVGLLVAVGQGALTVEAFRAVFAARVLARERLAPPEGLVFETVLYPPAIMAKLRGWQMETRTAETARTDLIEHEEAAAPALPQQEAG